MNELTSVLEEAVAKHGVPGSVAGVLVDGQTFTSARGVTSLEHPLPVDEHTLFQVGSITKTFTSAAVMVLVEEGRLSLDDPVGQHLPELGELTGLDTDAITIEHVLSHQAGFDGDHLFTHKIPDSLAPLADARRLFHPGAGFSYNNAAFSIAGEVIARVSGKPYAAFIRERLLLPLGMDTACFTADDAITHRVAAPHFVLGETTTVLRGMGWYPGWELGPIDLAAGGLIASVTHMLEWCRFQLSGETSSGKRLLDLTSLDRLHTPVVRGSARFECGLDWIVRGSPGGTTIEHPGETVGYCSNLVVARARGVGVVVLTHAVNGGAVNDIVRRWALERFASIVERDPEPDPNLAVDVSRYLGRYQHAFETFEIGPGDEGGTLLLTSKKREDTLWPPFALHQPTTYRFFAPDHAVSDGDGPKSVMNFGIGNDGRAEWLIEGLRRCPRIA